MAEMTMLEKIAARLLGWGYEAVEADTFVLEFLISKTENHIRDFCNIEDIPESLEQSEIDVICADFLGEKALSGGLDLSGITIESIASITEGDASVSYSGGSAFTLSKVCDAIKRKFEEDLMPFRAMRW
jgi:hypothetical protein